MKKIKILKGILKVSKLDKIFICFLILVFLSALFILFVEENITTYSDSLWYCYTIVSTVGFGDIVASTFIGRLISCILSVSAILVIAILTSVVINFYNQIIVNQNNEKFLNAIDKLENLDNLSNEELKELSKNIKEFRKKI